LHWKLKGRFCVVQDELTYQPWHTRRSLPPYCPYLATSNISPKYKVNANYNGQYSEEELFATFRGQIWEINKVVHPTSSSSAWMQEWLGSRNCPTVGAMHSLRSKKELAAVKQWEMHFWSNEGKEKWIEDHVERETAGERKWVADREPVVQQERDNSRKDENTGLRNREPKRLFRRWWLLSETVWVILHRPTMGRKRNMRTMKRQSKASRAKMANPASWWAQSPKRCSCTSRGFGRRRWYSKNWNNLDVMMQPNTSVLDISSMAHPNWGFQQSFNCNWLMMRWHLHWQHLESLWSDLTLTLEYCKRCKRLLNQEVVIIGLVRESCSRTWVYPVLCLPRSPSYHSFIIWSLLISQAFTPANSLPRSSPHKNLIRMRTWWRLLYQQKNREANWHCWRHILVKATCVPILLYVSIIWISVIKLWDMTICLCMYKSGTHHATDLESKSGCKTANTFDFCLLHSVQWETQSYISDEIY